MPTMTPEQRSIVNLSRRVDELTEETQLRVQSIESQLACLGLRTRGSDIRQLTMSESILDSVQRLTRKVAFLEERDAELEKLANVTHVTLKSPYNPSNAGEAAKSVVDAIQHLKTSDQRQIEVLRRENQELRQQNFRLKEQVEALTEHNETLKNEARCLIEEKTEDAETIKKLQQNLADSMSRVRTLTYALLGPTRDDPHPS